VKKIVAVLIVLFMVTSCIMMAGTVMAKGPGAEDKPGHGGAKGADDGLTALEDFRTGPTMGEKGAKGAVDVSQFPYGLPAELGIYQLTNVTGGCMHPIFSPDGRKIAYMNDTDSDTTWNRSIWVMELEFSSPPVVVNNYPVTDADDQCAHLEGWSPDGTKILFRSYYPGDSTVDRNRLWIANASGSGVPYELKAGVGNDSCFGGPTLYQASYSPDGSKIVYTMAYYLDLATWDRTGKDIYVMDAIGTNEQQLTYTYEECELSPRWSPDGSMILYKKCDFEGSGSGTADLCVMDEDGDNQRVVVAEVNANFFDWSPDGRWIVYEYKNTDSPSGYRRDIYKVRPDGSGNTRLTPSDDYCEHTPLWGPDGTILYRSDELKVEGITSYSSTWVMRPDGSAKTMINPWGGMWHDWGPSGEWIVFQTCEPPTTASAQIFIMRNPLYTTKVPALTPVGIIALIGLLSVVAAISIVRKEEKGLE